MFVVTTSVVCDGATTLPSSGIALVIHHLGCGGAQRVLTTLANAWADRGRPTCVITVDDSSDSFFPLDPAVRRIALGERKAPRWMGRAGTALAALRQIFDLRRALRDAGAPVAVGFIAPTNALLILASLGLGLRVIVSERNDPARQSFGWSGDLLRRLLYRRADVVTANSRGALRTMQAYVPQHKLALVPNPLDRPPATNAVVKAESRACRGAAPTILTVGRLHPQKAYDVLLDAFARISARAPDWRLAVIGEGPLEDPLRAQAVQLGIADRIDWLGQVPDPFRYYRAADVFVLASRYEGLPNALLEAMSCGRPVVVSDASLGPLEYVEHETTGLVVPVEDAAALASALERLIRDPALRRRLSDAARARVADHDLSNVMAVWEQVLGLGARNAE